MKLHGKIALISGDARHGFGRVKDVRGKALLIRIVPHTYLILTPHMPESWLLTDTPQST